MADGGIRGIRFTVFDPRSAAVSIDMIEPLAKRVADLDWHIQIHMRADQIVENAALLEGLPTHRRVRSPRPPAAARAAGSCRRSASSAA